MMKISPKWKKIWRETIEVALGMRPQRHTMLYRSVTNPHKHGYCTDEGHPSDSCGDVKVVVTKVEGNLDYIDELVLNNELEQYHLAGFLIEEAPQDKEKEFVRPLWAIEVFQNGRLARQITYYLQPRSPDKNLSDAVYTEVPSPSKNA